jgi:hypothetical protein
VTNETKTKPAWGIAPPDEATLCFGARAIYKLTTRTANKRTGRVETTATIELLHDRSDLVGGSEKERRVFVRWLNRVGFKHLRKECERRFVDPRGHKLVTIPGDDFTIVADPRASYGYLYIGAWRTPTVVAKTEAAP